jgi:regulator of protease activity HflC (stomatin/prohibitin superfamily)
MIRETDRSTTSGFLMLAVLLVVAAFSMYGFVQAARDGDKTLIFTLILVFIVDVVGLFGLFTVSPNQGAVLTLFGRYMGTAKTAGLHWANPFYEKRKISLRVRNFETAHLKVNDHDGNPIEIAAVVVWKVIDTAEACFEVDNYENYVNVQSESALRNLATAYSYDAHDDSQISLRGSTVEVSAHLKSEVHDRLSKAGVEVLEARISHMAYAPEIAAAMLQRQQASAIIAARTKIVEGACGMVEMALARLELGKMVVLDEERKAAMVSNLLVVLCSERSAQPIVNAGTIYH